MNLNIRNHIWGLCLNISFWSFIAYLKMHALDAETNFPARPEQLKAKCDEERLTHESAVLVIAQRYEEHLTYDLFWWDTFITQYVPEHSEEKLEQAAQEEMIPEDVVLQSLMVIWKRNRQHLFCFQSRIKAFWRIKHYYCRYAEITDTPSSRS